MPAYIFLCNKCSLWGTGETSDLKKYSYQCYRCHRKEKIVLKQLGTQVRYKGPLSAQYAVRLVQEVNREIQMKFEG